MRDKANCICSYPNKACAGQRQCHKHGHGFHGEKCDEASNAPGSNSARVFSKLKRNSSPTLTDPAYRVTMARDGQAQSWSENYVLQPPSTPPISGDSKRNDGAGWSGSKLVRELRSPTTFNPDHGGDQRFNSHGIGDARYGSFSGTEGGRFTGVTSAETSPPSTVMTARG